MVTQITIDRANETDIHQIMAILRANREAPSLIQRPEYEIKQFLKDFIIARDEEGQTVGCAALHSYSQEYAEIFSVAVLPCAQNKGIGQKLVLACHKSAKKHNIKKLWGSTYSLDYFSNLGYKPTPLRKLPISILVTKIIQILRRPPRYWLPVLRGKRTIIQVEL